MPPTRPRTIRDTHSSDPVTVIDAGKTQPGLSASQQGRESETNVSSESLPGAPLPFADATTVIGRTRNSDSGSSELNSGSSAGQESARRIGRYRVVRQLGAGGMGVVFEAVDEDNQRNVAVKLLSTGMASDSDYVERFIREGQLAARLSHPRTTFVYEAGQHQGSPYIVMELMPGKTLQDVLDESKSIQYQKAVDHILDVIDGLIAAHELGFIHRDVKPSNCFVDVDGRIKVGDFGLSKNLVVDAGLTQSGTFMGTPTFSAPEQIRGTKVDERTDQYAVAATLFNLIAGRPPFTGDAMAVTAQIVTDKPPRLSSVNANVPKDLDAIIDRALKKDPAERFDSLEELRRALLPFATGGATLAQVGRRAGAFMIDYVMLSLALPLLLAVINIALNVKNQAEGNQEAINENIYRMQLIGTALGWLATWIYFSLSEGFFGWSVGKRILGLRVVNEKGDSPGVWRGMLRALIVPGALMVPLVAMITRLLVNLDWNEPFTVEIMLGSWLLARVSEILPLLLCLLTMRYHNGFRGLHGFASGTRVIRVAEAYRVELRDLPQLAVDSALGSLPRSLGEFTVNGLISQNEETSLLIGTDPALGRQVFIFLSRHPNDVVRDINRPGRCRWIRSGTVDGRYWDAFEYINGVPFSFAVRDGRMGWDGVRGAVTDLAMELEAAGKHQELPDKLCLENFFIDHAGRGKLLDLPLPSATRFEDAEKSESFTIEELTDSLGDEDPERVANRLENSPRSEDVRSEPSRRSEPPRRSDQRERQARSYELLKQVFQMLLSQLILPFRDREKLQQFIRRPGSAQSLGNIVMHLQERGKQLARLRWDSRLGVLALTLGVEWTLLTGLMIGANWLYFSGFGFLGLYKTLLLFSFYIVLFFLVGYLYRSSPIFHFMDIDVIDRRGQAASRFQSGLRMMLAWAPFCFTMIGFVVMLMLGFEATQAGAARQQANSQANSVEQAARREVNETADKELAAPSGDRRVGI